MYGGQQGRGYTNSQSYRLVSCLVKSSFSAFLKAALLNSRRVSVGAALPTVPGSLGAVHHSDSAVMADPGQAVPRGREGHRVDPTPAT